MFYGLYYMQLLSNISKLNGWKYKYIMKYCFYYIFITPKCSDFIFKMLSLHYTVYNFKCQVWIHWQYLHVQASIVLSGLHIGSGLIYHLEVASEAGCLLDLADVYLAKQPFSLLLVLTNHVAPALGMRKLEGHFNKLNML